MSYAAVQPPAAPAAEAENESEVSGVLAVAGDPLDSAGLHAGVPVELVEVLPGGGVGLVAAVGTTNASGSFRIAMPAGTSTKEGRWLVRAYSAGSWVRAYVHPGAMRVDVGSEAWVRLVIAAAGRLVVFAGDPASVALKSISRSVSLVAGVEGQRLGQLSADAAAERLVALLRRDRAMGYVLSTLAASGTLPTEGVGDIGGFSAISNTYAAQFEGSDGVRAFVVLQPDFGSTMQPDGSWSFVEWHYRAVNGTRGELIAGAGGVYRSTATALFGVVPGSGVELTMLSQAIGQYPQRSFPLQAGERQLDARRITSTGLNFTGGTDEQPISFSSIERVMGVESVATAAGSVRAVRVVTEFEIGFPTSATAVGRLTARSTLWLAPRAGVVRTLDQVLIDGVLDTSTPDLTRELQQAWASDELWPYAVSLRANPVSAQAQTLRCFTLIPGSRRFITLVNGPASGGSPTLALELRDLDTGAQIGATRHFSGFASGCPAVAGDTGSVFVTETFFDRQALSAWPAALSTAQGASDVIHQLSGADLHELRTYAVAPVADATQPTLYWPGVVRSLSGAPGSTEALVIGVTQYDSFDWTSRPLFAQVLQAGTTGPRVNLGRVQIVHADWAGSRLFTWENFGATTLRATRFTLAGADATNTQVVSTGFVNRQVWYASGERVFMTDGTSMLLSTGGAGPLLGFDIDRCGLGSGELICLDAINDQLVRFDPETWARRETVPLGSYLRSQVLQEQDFSQPVFNLGGIVVLDQSTFMLRGFEVRVGIWSD